MCGKWENWSEHPRQLIYFTFDCSACFKPFFGFRAGFTCIGMIDLFIRSEQVLNGKQRELSHTRTGKCKTRISLETSKERKLLENIFRVPFQCSRKIRAFLKGKYFISSASCNENSIVARIILSRIFIRYTVDTSFP